MGEIFKTVGLSGFSLIVLFILTKGMGNKEISQLSLFDYIIGISIGSIAAEMSTALEDDFIQPLTAMIVYAVVTIFISFITRKSLSARKIITGRSLILFDNGKLYRKNIIKAKLDMSEFLMQCRNSGYFNLNDIQTAIFEENGKISFLPSSNKRPVTPEDLNLQIDQEKIVTNVILDGKILLENLKLIGNNEIWLQNELKKQKVGRVKDIDLATCDKDNNLSVYIKREIKDYKDYFE